MCKLVDQDEVLVHKTATCCVAAGCSIHLRPYGLRCLNWSSPYGLDQYALQALRPEVQKGQALRPGRWIKKNMQQVWNQDEVLVSHTIYLLFLWKRKSKTKRNQRISWAVRPKICFCPSGKTNGSNDLLWTDFTATKWSEVLTKCMVAWFSEHFPLQIYG